MTQNSTLKPLNDFAIVQPLDNQEQTESGIFLPEGKDKQHKRGRIVALGPGKLHHGEYVPIKGCDVGDVVLYDELSADDLPHNGNTYAVVKQGALITVIPE